MALDLTEFGLTEEQIAQINAEMDRARTQASQTARANAEREFNENLPNLVQDAVQQATATASMTAEQRAQEAFQQQLTEMSEQLAQVTRDRNRSINEAAIRRAGVTDDDTVAVFADMFAENPDGLDGFLTTFTKSVQDGVKAASQTAASSVTPPGASGGTVKNPPANSFNQATISQMVESNAETNGGFIDDVQLLADLRVAQQTTQD